MAKPNKQQVMSKFTRAAALKCYNIKVKVEFNYDMTQGFRVLGGFCDVSQKQPVIIFNSALFKEDELKENAWALIIHEVSHLKTINHDEMFWNELADNLEKTTELRNMFYEETGLDGDSYDDMDYTLYFDDARPDDAEIDEECLEHEDEFFEVYNIFRNVD